MALSVDEFLIGIRPQRQWGWPVVTYLFLGGAGAGLYLVALYAAHAWAAALGLLVLLAGVTVLLLDLGRPERFWRAFLRPRSSWISRGSFFVVVLIGLGTLDLVLRGPGMGALPFGGAPAAIAVRTLSAVAAILVMIYTGFILSASTGIPFWNSVLFPIIFLAYSLLAGIDILLLATPLLPGPPIGVPALDRIQMILSGVCLVLLAAHFAIASGDGTAARESIRLLTRGRWAVPFLGGVVGAGLLVPLALGGMAVWMSGRETAAVLTVLPVFRLCGDYLFRFLVVRAGLYDSLL
jgi:formate-dependent nitrite reductase membrane component NrfD